MQKWFYQVILWDNDKIVRRENVSKSIAKAVYDTFCAEMIHFNVKEVTYGPMPPR